MCHPHRFYPCLRALFAIPVLALGSLWLHAQEPSAEAFRSDYQKACHLLATRHPLLEEKTRLDRTAFEERIVRQGLAILQQDPSRTGFIQAMAALRASVPDGHLDWSLGDGQMTSPDLSLGLVLTLESGRLRVARTAPHLDQILSPGDEIVAWNGGSPETALADMAVRIPQSTREASLEEAARMLTFQPSWQPIHPRLTPVAVKVRTPGGAIREAVLAWKENTLPLNRNGKLSLEDMPADAEAIHTSLRLFFRSIEGREVAILHPRAFLDWTASDLDRAMARILARKAEILVIDLRDSAGGSFEQVSILGQALGLPHPLRWILQFIDPATGQMVHKTQTYEAEEGPQGRWKGLLLVRTNAICGSGCDYFAHWVKASRAGLILGQPTAGRGLGTDEVTLGTTGTTLTLPVRQRLLLPGRLSIEGHGVQPDLPCSGDLADNLKAYVRSLKPPIS